MNDIAQAVLVTAVIGVLLVAAASVVFYRIGGTHRKKFAEAHIESAEKEALRIVNEATEKSRTLHKSMLVEAKDEIFKQKAASDKEIAKQKSDNEREAKERRKELTQIERSLRQKEETLDKKTDKVEKIEEAATERKRRADEIFAEAERLKNSQIEVLERIGKLSVEDAKHYLLAQLDIELTNEKGARIIAYEHKLKEESDEKAREYIAAAITRLASETVSEMTVSTVAISSDEMKGRIIGREGRNIRTLEQLTGVSLIIDDTPETITLSSHDRIRREVARLAIEWLLDDGRIHPTRIEEMVEKAKREVELRVKREGERAILAAGVNGINHELTKLLGRLHYRTSYSQNVLSHSIEVSHIAGMMASELGIDPAPAKRAGLLHDIGKALNHDVEGSHVHIGVEICKKYKENPEIIHAVEAHHGDVPIRTVTAALVQAADAVSAARPGARSENYENYIKRLQKLEEICTSYNGVEKCYAIQAGREIRVMIKPDIVSDEAMAVLAREMVKRIEKDMEYPGQVRVHLIRESRIVEFAK